MLEAKYIWGVYVVQERNEYGLLLQRRLSASSHPESAYFWLFDGGLSPRREVLEICDTNFYPLEATAHAQRIFSVLKKFAEHHKGRAEQENKNTAPFQEICDVNGDIYSDSLYKLLKKDPNALKDFVGRDEFEAGILDRPWNENEFERKAQFIDIIQLIDLPVIPPYFTRAKDLLQIKQKNVKPEWFRPGGIVAADIKEEKVSYDKAFLAEIRQFVTGNFFSQLIGDPATGKSTIIRLLAYDLINTGTEDVYYFSFAKTGQYDVYQLIEVLEKWSGIFLLDDIHLATPEVGMICSELEKAEDKHILFVKTNVSQVIQCSEPVERAILEGIPTKEVVPSFETAQDIVAKFISSPEHKKLFMAKDLGAIPLVFGKDLWHLSYALKGWRDSKGKGILTEWVQHGVKQELEDLRNCEGERKNEKFPDVMVALAGLYQFEVLTDKDFLVNHLGIDARDLAALTIRGQIVETEKEGVLFYGLHHTSVAAMFWEHGKNYRKRKALLCGSELFYHYFQSGATNAVEALRSSRRSVIGRADIGRVIDKVQEHGQLLRFFRNAQSLDTIIYFINHHGRRIRVDNNLLEFIGSRISEDSDFDTVNHCLRKIWDWDENARKNLWKYLDPAKLMRLFYSSKGIYLKISFLIWIIKEEIHTIWKVKNIDDLFGALVEECNRCNDLFDICYVINNLVWLEPSRFISLYKHLNRDLLLNKLISSGKQDPLVFFIIRDMYKGKRKFGREVFESLVEDLIDRLNDTMDPTDVGRCISQIYDVNEDAGLQLWYGLKLERWMNRLNFTSEIETFRCFWGLRELYKSHPRNFAELIDLDWLGVQLHRSMSVGEVGEGIGLMYEFDPEYGARLLGKLRKEDFAKKLCQANQAAVSLTVLSYIGSCDPTSAGTICNYLILEQLAKTIVEDKDFGRHEEFCELVSKFNAEKGNELREAIVCFRQACMT